MYGTIKDTLAKKGERPPADVDPQDLTAADTLSPEQILQLFWEQLRSCKKEAARDLAMGTSMMSGAALQICEFWHKAGRRS